jgi:ubiquinone/menaquinone biosynthesis C-methylase UbiE
VDGIPVFLPDELDDLKKGEAEYHSRGIESFDETHRLDMLRNQYYHDDFLSRITDLPRGAHILELACGMGHDGRKLMAAGMNVVETDVALECVRETRRRAESSGLPLTDLHSAYMVIDAEMIPFASGSFDAVFVCAGLHHLPDPLMGLAQMRMCVKKDGIVILGIEPNAWPYYVFYPVFLPLLWKVSALGRLILRPKEFLRTSRLARSIRSRLGGSDAIEMTEQDSLTRGESPADEITKGFSLRAIRGLLDAAGLELVHITRVWYLNGLIHEVPILLRMNLSRRAERLLIAFDETLARVPVLKQLNWHWNIVARPKPVDERL